MKFLFPFFLIATSYAAEFKLPTTSIDEPSFVKSTVKFNLSSSERNNNLSKFSFETAVKHQDQKLWGFQSKMLESSDVVDLVIRQRTKSLSPYRYATRTAFDRIYVLSSSGDVFCTQTYGQNIEKSQVDWTDIKNNSKNIFTGKIL